MTVHLVGSKFYVIVFIFLFIIIIIMVDNNRKSQL